MKKIINDVDYNRVMAKIDSLMAKGSDKASSEQLEEIRLLAQAAQAYEQTNFVIDAPTTTLIPPSIWTKKDYLLNLNGSITFSLYILSKSETLLVIKIWLFARAEAAIIASGSFNLYFFRISMVFHLIFWFNW